MTMLRNISIFLKAYPIAKAKIKELASSQYKGEVRMQIAYSAVKGGLWKLNIRNEDIVGAIIYLAISLAYLLNKKNK